MPLPSQILQFPFQRGLAEGTDPKQAPPGTLTRADNIVWLKSNLAEKRPGTQQIGTDGIDAGKRIFTRGEELCVIDGISLHALSTATDRWKNVGLVPEVGLTWEPLADTATGIAATDSAISALGEVVNAWITGDPTASLSTTPGQLFVQVIDKATGTVLLEPTDPIAVTILDGVRVHVIGTNAYIIYKNVSGGVADTIRGIILDLTTRTFAAPITLRADSEVGGGGWDTIVIESSPATIVLAYEDNGAAPKINLHSYDTALAAVTNTTLTQTGNGFNISIAGIFGEVIYVAFSCASANLVRYATADATTLIEVLAPVTIEAVASATRVACCRFDANSAVVSYQVAPAGSVRTSSAFCTSAGVVSQPRGTWYTIATCRPFMLGGRCYMALSESIPTTFETRFTGANVYLVEVENIATASTTTTPHRYVGKIDTLIGARPENDSPIPSPVLVSATEAIFPSFYLAVAPATFATWRTGLRLVSATIGVSLPKDMWRTVSYGKDLFMCAGVLQAYDGRSVFDYGFARAPVILASLTTSPAGAIVAGDYLYGMLLEYVAATGMIHRSAPGLISLPFTIAGTPSNVAFTVFGTAIGGKQDLGSGFINTTSRTVLIAMYRSTVGGSVRQRLTFDPSFNTVYNNPRVVSQAYNDGRADTDIDGAGTDLSLRPALYTTGGILDDQQPVGGVTLFLHKSRMWQLAGDRKTWWYSKSFQDDLGIAPGFHPGFRVLFDELQTGGASLDEKAIFFSPSSVSYLVGDGPAPNGQNSDYGSQGTASPIKIQCDSGCTNARSIVSTPDGIMYEGEGDIYILTRGLEVEWIGRPIQDQLDDFPVITSAVLLAARNEVRFSANDTTGENGIVLVYNYIEKQWSTFQYTVGTNTSAAIADACLWQGLYTFLTPAGLVFQEDPTTNLDEGKWVTMDVETAEVFAEGPLSYQLVRWIFLKGELLSQCDVTLRVAVGGRATYDQTKVWKSGVMQELGTAKVGVHVRRQKSDSIRWRMTDAPPSSLGLVVGSGKGINLSALGFDIAPMPGLDRRSAKARK